MIAQLFIVLAAISMDRTVHVSESSYVEILGQVEEQGKLKKEDVSIHFDDSGLEILSGKKLKFISKDGIALTGPTEVEGQPGMHRYRLKYDNREKILEKAAVVSVTDRDLILKLDKEAMPLSEKHSGKQVAQQDSLSSKIKTTIPITRVIWTLGGIIFCFLLSIFVLRKVGGRSKWLNSFLGNQKYKTGPLIETISTHTLGPKRQIVVIRAGGEFLLIGCSGDQMSLISKIDDQSIQEENDLLEREIQNRREMST